MNYSTSKGDDERKKEAKHRIATNLAISDTKKRADIYVKLISECKPHEIYFKDLYTAKLFFPSGA